jgi:hypothetical protein
MYVTRTAGFASGKLSRIGNFGEGGAGPRPRTTAAPRWRASPPPPARRSRGQRTGARPTCHSACPLNTTWPQLAASWGRPHVGGTPQCHCALSMPRQREHQAHPRLQRPKPHTCTPTKGRSSALDTAWVCASTLAWLNWNAGSAATGAVGCASVRSSYGRGWLGCLQHANKARPSHQKQSVPHNPSSVARSLDSVSPCRNGSAATPSRTSVVARQRAAETANPPLAPARPCPIRSEQAGFVSWAGRFVS